MPVTADGIDWDADTDEILELAASVYDGLPEQDVNEIESIALNRRTFFRERDF